MIAKKLEALLGELSGRTSSEMVQRFHSIRQYQMLPNGRGKNAQDVWTYHVVCGILSLVAAQPSMAGEVVKQLISLRSVGGVNNDLIGTLRDMIDHDFAWKAITEIRVSEGKVGSPDNWRICISYIKDGEERTDYFVHKDRMDLLQVGADREYDCRAMSGHMVVETVFYRSFLEKLAKALGEDNYKEKYAEAKRLDNEVFARSLEDW